MIIVYSVAERITISGFNPVLTMLDGCHVRGKNLEMLQEKAHSSSFSFIFTNVCYGWMKELMSSPSHTHLRCVTAAPSSSRCFRHDPQSHISPLFHLPLRTSPPPPLSDQPSNASAFVITAPSALCLDGETACAVRGNLNVGVSTRGGSSVGVISLSESKYRMCLILSSVKMPSRLYALNTNISPAEKKKADVSWQK